MKSETRKQILIFGAGAIGRGFLPWKFAKYYDISFIDTNVELVRMLAARGSFATYMVRDRKLVEMKVPVRAALTPDEFDPRVHGRDVAAVFINVGPRNSVRAASLARDLSSPVILCENDPAKVDDARLALGNDKVFFAIPDVITSNTTSPDLLAKDPLAVSSEDGILFIDQKGCDRLEGDFTACDSAELLKQWTAKLYLHNTPHCVAAYLGALRGLAYVHESMAVESIRAIVAGSMREMLATIAAEWPMIPSEFLRWYADKELARFSDSLLFDPISRVAREPLRKLERNGRLIGAAQLAFSHGIVPGNTLVGIGAAMLFDDHNDPDRHLSFMRRSMPVSDLLTQVLGLRRGEVLEMVLTRKFDDIAATLRTIEWRGHL